MLNEKREQLVLIVEDAEDTRDVYAHFLMQKQFRVAVAKDGQEALDKSVELQPDLILMDLSLPGMGGSVATQRLKKDKETRHIPVIIVTADSVEGTKTVINAGCQGFLIKPCLAEDLLKEIKRVLH